MRMIARESFTRGARNVIVVGVLATLGAGVGATSASATTREVGCAELQAALETAGSGAKVVLNGMCAGSYTLPSNATFTLEGAPGTTSGFDGAGAVAPLLGNAVSTEAGAMTISNLTFQHAHLTEASALSIRASQLTLNGDGFLENEEHGENAHAAFGEVGHTPSSCPTASGPPAITLTDSKFSKNKLILGSGPGGGAAAWLEDTCELSRNVLEGNTFEGNVVEAVGTVQEALVTGAGLHFQGGETQPAPMTQRGNVFGSNSIVAAAPAVGNYGGGGEWLEDASVSSVGDRFSRNLIAGTVGEGSNPWSWGAGLGVENCNRANLIESTLEDAVVTGNAIGPGTEWALGGGGIWVGCSRLRVLNSTVTLNRSPNGTGIEGEPGDQLVLANSIVTENSGYNELAGFNESSGGSVTASYSDVCASVESNTPLSGIGNICANPLLTDDGNPTSFDVHETESSPTIDAGSNALVPASLSTDFYGNPRILSGRSYTPTCVPGEIVSPTLDAPVVDMGASELGPIAVPALAALCPTATSGAPTAVTSGAQVPGTPGIRGPISANASVFAFPSLTQRPSGTLMLVFRGLATGRLDGSGTFNLTRSVVSVTKGRHRRASRVETIAYGHASHTVTSAGNLTLELRPTKRALQVLTHDKRLQVRLTITFTAADAAPSSRNETITVVYRGPSQSIAGRSR